MQRLKDEVRQALLSAALREFSDHGFERASLRHIAERAGTTPGNIYAYFKNKEDLLDQAMAPVLKQIDTLVSMSATTAAQGVQNVRVIAQDVAHMYTQNATQFYLMTNGKAGAKYAHLREDLNELVCGRLHDVSILCGLRQSREVSYALAHALVSGVLDLCFRLLEQPDALFHALEQFLTIFLTGMAVTAETKNREESSTCPTL